MSAEYAKVSIIIPNYNKACYIQRSLDSVLSQTIQDWEAIVVDDCSTDESWELIQEFARRDARISAYRNDVNRGGNYCRNLGIDQSKGEFLIFLDSDDWLVSDCVEGRINEISLPENSNVDMLLFKMVGAGDGKCGAVYSAGNLTTALYRFLRHEMPWQTMMPIMRRRVFEKVGKFDEAFPRLQDVEFFSRCLLMGIKLGLARRTSYDCFYCTDMKRRGVDYANVARRGVLGSRMYVEKMQKLIEGSHVSAMMKFHCRRALRETLYSGIRGLGDLRQAGYISRELELALRSESLPKRCCAIYCFCYDIGLNQVHGFNFLFLKFYRFLASFWLSIGKLI